MKPVAKLRFYLQDGETATSFVSRFSRYCGLDSVSDFCLDQGFRWPELIAGDDFALDALARVSGEDPKRLRQWAIRNDGARHFYIAGFPAPRNAIRRTQVRPCPECLLEDRAKHGPNGAYRRYFWQLSAIRTCAIHKTFLIDLPMGDYTIRNYDYVSNVEEHHQLIDHTLSQAEEIGPDQTAYEKYVFQRISGKIQLPFLDRLSLDVACKLCETLGCVMLFGRDRKLRTVSEQEFWQAGQAGFDTLRNGEAGLKEALISLRSEHSVRTGSYNKDLGALYLWLHNSSLNTELEPLRELIRDIIRQNYPISGGRTILGKRYDRSSVYTVSSGFRALGIKRKRMHRHLIEQGLAAPEKDGTSVKLHRKIGEADLKAYQEEARKRLTAQQAAKHLNICVELLRDLKAAGLIETVNDSYCPGPRYHQDRLDEFLKHLGTCLTPPDPDETYIPLNKAAAGLKCKIPRLVRHLMEGKLIATGDTEINGLAGIQIGVNATKTALHDIDLPGLTRSDAALKLSIRHQTLAWLIEERFLQTVKMRNPKSGARITAICKLSIDRFLKDHITLGLLARKYGRKPGPFGCFLEHKGI